MTQPHYADVLITLFQTHEASHACNNMHTKHDRHSVDTAWAQHMASMAIASTLHTTFTHTSLLPHCTLPFHTQKVNSRCPTWAASQHCVQKAYNTRRQCYRLGHRSNQLNAFMRHEQYSCMQRREGRCEIAAKKSRCTSTTAGPANGHVDRVGEVCNTPLPVVSYHLQRSP